MTGLVYDDRFLLHRAPYEHPEHPRRLKAIHDRLIDEGLFQRCRRVEAREATAGELEAVHTRGLIEAVRATSGRDFTQLDPDTYACRDSAEAAWLAAGGLAELTTRVVRGELDNGFALPRPPGHHAEADLAMGFCLFNNVAIAARAARAAGASRVLIVDWDVHHGNGTQHSFWNDPSVLYFSTHQFPFYPGTGAADELGGAQRARPHRERSLAARHGRRRLPGGLRPRPDADRGEIPAGARPRLLRLRCRRGGPPGRDARDPGRLRRDDREASIARRGTLRARAGGRLQPRGDLPLGRGLSASPPRRGSARRRTSVPPQRGRIRGHRVGAAPRSAPSGRTSSAPDRRQPQSAGEVPRRPERS